MTTDPQVRAYLTELDRALAGRPAAQRELVVDGVRQHVDDAVASGVPVDRVLDDLGDPLAIAAEAGDPAPPVQPVSSFLDRRGGSVLIVLLLAVGGYVVPLLGWIAGVVLLWSSRGWRTSDKVVGTVTAPAFVGLSALIGAVGWWTTESVFETPASASAPSGGGTSLGPLFPEAYDLTWTAILLLPVIQLAVGVYLLLRFRPA